MGSLIGLNIILVQAVSLHSIRFNSVFRIICYGAKAKLFQSCLAKATLPPKACNVGDVLLEKKTLIGRTEEK